MRERPILFNGAMVRAILAGQKTQTRRVLRMPWGFYFIGGSGDDLNAPHNWGAEHEDGLWWALGAGDGIDRVLPCPFGQPGDRLWVREATEADYDTCDCVTLSRYSADLAPVCYPDGTGDGFDGSIQHWKHSRDKRPSIHMPRSMCRLVLEITAVRVERLQAISEADAMAEGLSQTESGSWLPGPCDHPEWAFHQLWAQVYGEPAWEANPWVWVIEFKRVEVAGG